MKSHEDVKQWYLDTLEHTQSNRALCERDRDYYDENRILCMAQYLFDVQQKNRLEQKGLLKRFSINCYGKQETLEDMRNTKAEKYKELKGNRKSLEYESWFLRYIPFEVNMEKRERKKIKHDEKVLKTIKTRINSSTRQLNSTRKRATKKRNKGKSKTRSKRKFTDIFTPLNML